MVKATEGDSVSLDCNYTIDSSSKTKIPWYKWYRCLLNWEEISNTTEYFKGRVSTSSPHEFIDKASANIVLHNVTITDSGMYICEVNINGISRHGNGTFIYVKEREYEDFAAHVLITVFISIRIMSVVLAVVVLLIVFLCHNKKGKQLVFPYAMKISIFILG
uniref:Natural cytotoxicity triggering receptor 3 n=1 Tax=Leptobrachium leishanense TaxID=445787 RepID=A0A8C5PXB8_9ANUR